jgi:PleD family two-component response regulator
VIDDDEALVADMISEELSGGNFEVSCLTSPLRVLELLSEVQTDLVLIHADMQGLGGFELCRTLRALPEWQALPIILATNQQDEELMIAAYKAGADDYVNLSTSSNVIRACIEGRLERSRMVQERADRDGLTGLLIRRAFNDALLGQMASAKRRGSTVAVCLIDLDHFKLINDTYGHLAGD